MDRNKMVENLIGKEVKVKLRADLIVPGIICGRNNPWASIHVPGQVAGIIYAWETVNNAVNGNYALLV